MYVYPECGSTEPALRYPSAPGESPEFRSDGRQGVQALWGIGGMPVILGIAFASSTNRRAINLRTVIGALAITVVSAIAVPYRDLGRFLLG